MISLSSIDWQLVKDTAEQVEYRLCDSDSRHSFLLFPSNILKNPLSDLGAKKLLESGSITWVCCVCLTASFISAVKPEKYICWNEGMGFRRGRMYWLWRLKCRKQKQESRKEDQSRKRPTARSRKWEAESLWHWYLSSRDAVTLQLSASQHRAAKQHY